MPQNSEDKIKELIDSLNSKSTILDIKAILIELENTQADFSHSHLEKDISNLDRMRYLGEWDKDTLYSVNDVVKYKAKIYICVADNKGNRPTDEIYWEVLIKIEKQSVTVIGGGGGGGQGGGTAYTAGDGLALVGSVFSNIDKGTSAIATHEITYNHALFITSETDPIFTAWNKSTGISITESQVTDLDKYTQAEIDAFLTNKPNWDTAYGWGDHSVEGYLKTLAHTGLSDMPDTLGVNADHDARYVKKSGDTITGDLVGKDFIPTRSGVITRDGDGYIISVEKTGGLTTTITRNVDNYISSTTDGVRTWTFTRDIDNRIISWEVS